MASSTHSSTSLPPSISLQDLVTSLFSNIEYDYNAVSENAVVKSMTFSRATLSPEQLALIVYPEGATPLNFYIVYLIELTQDTHRTYIVSFSEKAGYIYGNYYLSTDAPALDKCLLKKSKTPVQAPDGEYVVRSYVELYIKVDTLPAILSLDTTSDTPPVAGIQFGRCHQYFEANLDNTGLEPSNPKMTLTGLSRNLHNICL